jgi:tetratricopeptide (TPR) repeat protein
MAEGPDEQTARAKRFIAERNYDEAIRICRRVLLTSPERVDVRLLLGEALLATQRYEQVRVEMMALARKQPNLAVLHRILGEAYLRSGQTEKAKDALRRAVELDPRDRIARDLLDEAVDDEAPVSETIERWFGDEEPKTVEQDAPPFTEEPTPVPRPAQAGIPVQPSIEVDPALRAEAAALRAASLSVVEPPPALRPHPDEVRAALAPVQDPNTQPGRPQARRRRDPGTDDLDLAGVPSLEDLTIESLELALDGDGDPLEDATTGRGRRRVDDYDHEPTRALPALRPPNTPGGEFAPARPRTVPPLSSLPRAALSPLSPSAPRAGPPPSAPPPANSSVRPPGSSPPRAGPPPSAPPPAFGGSSFGASAAAALSPLSPSAPRAGPPPSAPPPALGPAALPAVPPEAPISTETIMRPLPEAPSSVARPFLGGGATARSAAAPELAREWRGTTPPDRTAPRQVADPRQATGESVSSTTSTATQRWPRLLLGSRRTLSIALGVLALVSVLGALGYLKLSRVWADEAIHQAAWIASADGRRHSIERALATIEARGADEPWRIALAARLLATLTLEHGDDRTREVLAALARLGPDPAAYPDALVARALVLLASGQAEDALRVLAVLQASDPEALRARAWAAALTGRMPEAEQSAAAAVRAAPGAARHVAFYAVLRHQRGDSQGAIDLLSTVPNGNTSPAVCAARARILAESGGDPQQVLVDATRVIDELGPTATATELAWARLARAQVSVRMNAPGVARSDALEALERMPRPDEHFVLTAVATLLQVGASADARRAFERLPASSTDPVRRALVGSEVALANGDLAAAERLLPQAGGSARADLLRGRFHEARGELELARQAYTRAVNDATQEITARVRLAAVLLLQNRAREAMVHLDRALRLAPADSEVSTLFVRAALAAGDVVAAERAIAEALRQSPESIELIAAQGLVLLARGQVDAGLAALARASDQRPQNPLLRVELGEAALRAGRRDVAAQAFQRALEISPGLVRAHVGRALVAMDEARFDEAERAIAGAEQNGASALDGARLRAALAVARGLGAAGVPAVQAAIQRHGRDAALYASLGALYVQAEASRDAADAFAQALRLDPDQPEAHLGRAWLDLLRQRIGPAARAIDRAERVARQRGLPASFFARIQVARARMRFETLAFEDARRGAEEALRLDPKCGEAHWLLASIALERDADVLPHLRAAVEGTHTPPEAVAQLVISLRSGAEACAFARRYREAAPDGYDRRDVERVLQRCR